MATKDETEDLLVGSDLESDAEEKRSPSSRDTETYISSGERRIRSSKVPWGTWALENCGLCVSWPLTSHKSLVFFLTFISYTCYHLSRKPFSVVKVVLCPDCANASTNGDNGTGWAPFNGTNGKTLMGSVDYSWLFAYAVAMFFSGWIADRVNLRYFLTIGMIGSGISVSLLGVAYFANIHHLWYFIVVQVFGGILQSTGWPGVVAVMSTWFGIHNRGLIMGIWNMHTSIGNILGTIIPSFWADVDEGKMGHENMAHWGWAFVVPGCIIFTVGVLVFLFLVTDPYHVGLPRPIQQLDDDMKPGNIRNASSSPAPPPPSHRPGNGEIITESYAENFRHNKQWAEGETTEGRAAPRPQSSGGAQGKWRKEEEEEGKLYSSLSRSQINTPQQRGVEQQARPGKSKAVGFLKALLIPGVIEFSLALFFNKLVAYTFLYWLPFYVKTTNPHLSAEKADWLSTLFDIGGIIGAISAGFISDRLNARATTCVSMLILAVPSLFILRSYGSVHIALYVVLLIVCGVFVNGPYGIITSAVSSDLGTHKSLRGDQNAKATVTAIIDGTGSLGAAFGPLLIGWITDESQKHSHSNDGWTNAFYFLMGSCFLSALFLSRLVYTEAKRLYLRVKHGSYDVVQ